MSFSGFRRFSQDQGAAVAPTVALALFALIGMGGLAFDFARMANLDTELQTAADQAALAAASQLDGTTGARDRATLAANTLISNPTRFANDGDTGVVGIATVTYYVDKAGATEATGDSDANFVDVTVETRTANFALTPIVDALSADMSASAFAGVGSAICGVVPFFICNPTEPVGNTDPYLEVGVQTGVGIVMAEGGTSWGPGNFGFIDQLGNGANGVAQALAQNSIYGTCSPTEQVTTETGNILNAVRDSLNMRFDYAAANNATCGTGPCSPSNNSIKDLVRPSATCSWQENPADIGNFQSRRYRPTSNATLDSSITPNVMGHPRDICHAWSLTGNCAYGRIGDGVWDRAAYFRSNHPSVDWVNDPDLGPNVTRYQTYLWEAADATRRGSKVSAGDSSLSTYGTPQAGRCAAPGLDPDPAGTDRRRITAAVVNCRRVSQTPGLNGKRTIPVAGFIDVFLVEPSLDRKKCDGNGNDPCNVAYTSRNDIYVEAIGAAGTGEGGSVAQISRRDVPRLIR